MRRDIIEIAEKLCKEIKAGIIEGEACPDHIHVLVGDPLYMKYNKVRWNAQELERTDGFNRHANLKDKYERRKFWCRGYFVDTERIQK